MNSKLDSIAFSMRLPIYINTYTLLHSDQKYAKIPWNASVERVEVR